MHCKTCVNWIILDVHPTKHTSSVMVRTHAADDRNMQLQGRCNAMHAQGCTDCSTRVLQAGNGYVKVEYAQTGVTSSVGSMPTILLLLLSRQV